MKRHHGFTLVELLVVIAIISILAAFLFPLMSQAIQQARSFACLGNMRFQASALQYYLDDNGQRMPYMGLTFTGALDGYDRMPTYFNFDASEKDSEGFHWRMRDSSIGPLRCTAHEPWPQSPYMRTVQGIRYFRQYGQNTMNISLFRMFSGSPWQIYAPTRAWYLNGQPATVIRRPESLVISYHSLNDPNYGGSLLQRTAPSLIQSSNWWPFANHQINGTVSFLHGIEGANMPETPLVFLAGYAALYTKERFDNAKTYGDITNIYNK